MGNSVSCSELPGDLLAELLKQADRVPGRTAVVVGSRTLTYAELDAATADSAARLVASGVRPGQVVLLHLRQSLDTVVSMFAALRAGAAWCVVEPGQSITALRAVLAAVEVGAIGIDPDESATRPEAVVAALSLAGEQVPPILPVVAADTERLVPAPSIEVPPQAPAYVMMTSGSTGVPKAVVVSRANLAALTVERAVRYRDGEPVTLSAMRMTFDGIFMGAAGTFAVGGTNVFPDHRMLPDAAAVASLAAHWRATGVVSTPSFYRLLLPHLAGLGHPVDTVSLAGEALSPTVVDRHRAALPGTTLINEYGPTEATVTCIRHIVTPNPGATVPIGKPTPGSTAYVLGPKLAPMPQGVVGELYLGGAQIAMGYAEPARGNGGALRSRSVRRA